MLLNMTCIYAQCPNGDAEMNNLSNWQTYVGNNSTGTLNLSTFTPGPSPTQHAIVSAGNDPIVGASLSTVAEGNYAFKLGNTNTGNGAEIMSYTFTAGSSFSFMYALILQGAHSTPGQNGFFSFWISTTNNLASSTAPGNLVPIPSTPFIVNGDSSDPYFRTTTYDGAPLAWKEWQTQCISIPPQYIGQQLTIYFATADCNQGGHFGYAYIDALCKPMPPVPVLNGPSMVCNIDTPIIFDGSGTTNESQFIWDAQECDAAGNPIGNPIPAIINNGPVGTYILKSNFLLNFVVKNGHYYKVKLRVRNCGSSWVEVSKIVKINYPPIQANNIVACCGSSVKLSATVDFPGAGTASNYKWYDEAGNFVGNGTISWAASSINGPFIAINQINVTPSRSTKYRLVYEHDGCKNEKWVYVTLIKSLIGGFQCVNAIMCGGTGVIKYIPWIRLCGSATELGADYNFHMQQATNSITYSWSTGSTTDSSTVTAGNTYTLTVKSACGSYTETVKPPVLAGAFPNLFKSTGMTMTNPFIIYDTTMLQNQMGAYNATKFELKVFDRFGNIVYSKFEDTCIGFYNGQITWNGTTNVNGNTGYVNLNAVYHWTLRLENCSGSPQVYGGDVTFL